VKLRIGDFRFSICALLALALGPGLASAQPATHAVYPIDLPTALRLAGAQNLDVQIAREKLAEARAIHAGAIAQFFPWLSPGVSYHRREGFTQAVPAGTITDAHFQSYAPGGALVAQVALGDAIYNSLASKKLAQAAGEGLEAQRQDSVLAAAQGYFGLAFAQAAVTVAAESVGIFADYEKQLQSAVEAGIAFKGDLLRVRVQLEQSRLSLRQAGEQQRVAGARLAQVLHLDPAVELAAQDTALAPLALVETNAALDSLVQQTLAHRPELKQSRSLAGAARDAKNGSAYGPLLPSVGAQAFFGGLGGGPLGTPGTFGGEEDYLVGVSWRIGPGGLFDSTRLHASDARLKAAELATEKLRDELTRQVVEAFTRWQSLADQLDTARRALAAAEEGLSLAQQRREFAVGIVLETIQAGQDLTRARRDYLKAVADFNTAQYALQQATGKL
jgi:outer membrane protein TolC